MWSKYLSKYIIYNNVWRDFRLPMSASVMVTKKVRLENQFFAENLQLQLFHAAPCYPETKIPTDATVASADTES